MKQEPTQLFLLTTPQWQSYPALCKLIKADHIIDADKTQEG
jgi:hypothetical protein